MKIKLKTKEITIEQFVKRAFYLLYNACGGTAGMGFLQVRNEATEDDVWNNVVDNGDYPGPSRSKVGSPYGDYVFGRMMKWGCKFNKDEIKFREGKFDRSYQAFSREYKNNKAIADAVMKSFNIKNGYEIMEEE